MDLTASTSSCCIPAVAQRFIVSHARATLRWTSNVMFLTTKYVSRAGVKQVSQDNERLYKCTCSSSVRQFLSGDGHQSLERQSKYITTTALKTRRSHLTTANFDHYHEIHPCQACYWQALWPYAARDSFNGATNSQEPSRPTFNLHYVLNLYQRDTGVGKFFFSSARVRSMTKGPTDPPPSTCCTEQEQRIQRCC